MTREGKFDGWRVQIWCVTGNTVGLSGQKNPMTRIIKYKLAHHHAGTRNSSMWQ